MMIDEYESVYISDHEWKHLPEPFLSDFKNQRRNYRSRLAAILQKGIDEKEICAVNPYVAVLTILICNKWNRRLAKIRQKNRCPNCLKKI